MLNASQILVCHICFRFFFHVFYFEIHHSYVSCLLPHVLHLPRVSRSNWFMVLSCGSHWFIVLIALQYVLFVISPYT